MIRSQVSGELDSVEVWVKSVFQVQYYYLVSGELDSVEDPSTPPPRYSHHTPIVSGELDSVEAPHPILELCHLHTPPFQENWIVWKSLNKSQHMRNHSGAVSGELDSVEDSVCRLSLRAVQHQVSGELDSVEVRDPASCTRERRMRRVSGELEIQH